MITKKLEKNLKSEKAITLIALVITIIVLLILAAISISMLSGENSILNRAGQARDMTGEKQIQEKIRLAVAGAIANGNGSITEDLLTAELNKQFGEDGYDLIDKEDNSWDVKVGEVTENVPIGKDSNSTYSDEVKTALAEGKYVTYKNKPYVVLYNDNNGIEIIAMESIGTVKLGKIAENIPQTATGYNFTGENADFEKARWSYNNAIESLNEVAEELFPNDGIIDDSRCVGSVPGRTNGVTNKNTRNSTKYVHGTYNSFFSSYDNQFEQGEIVIEMDKDNRFYRNEVIRFCKLYK